MDPSEVVTTQRTVKALQALLEVASDDLAATPALFGIATGLVIRYQQRGMSGDDKDQADEILRILENEFLYQFRNMIVCRQQGLERGLYFQAAEEQLQAALALSTTGSLPKA